MKKILHAINSLFRPQKLVIAVDFDGTIVKNRWPEIGPWKLGARSVLTWLKSRSHTVIIWTCREGEEQQNARQHLLENNRSYFHYFNQNIPERVEQYGIESRKVSADWYVDDKAGFVGWWSIPFIVLWQEHKLRRMNQ